ncbi:MAG: hypothetical protein ABEI52_00485 [Halobacteriaceae archaeon]
MIDPSRRGSTPERKMASKLTPVALDIETTGLKRDDELTVIGMAMPLGCRVFFNTGERSHAKFTI